ncbi:MAG: hypothetical protein KJ666_07550 [Bacteroidetes bacterium]|nr:hypothetical protein [Bacteroidota bacterium]MBU2585661.1 hypothetical protein [Bacteroidota bacterium]
MKKLEIDSFKSKEAFRKNYELHDKAAKSGVELLTKWGFMLQEFGKDKRYERIWESNLDLEDKAGIKEKINGSYLLPTDKFKMKTRDIAGDDLIIEHL